GAVRSPLHQAQAGTSGGRQSHRDTGGRGPPGRRKLSTSARARYGDAGAGIRVLGEAAAAARTLRAGPGVAREWDVPAADRPGVGDVEEDGAALPRGRRLSRLEAWATAADARRHVYRARGPADRRG